MCQGWCISFCLLSSDLNQDEQVLVCLNLISESNINPEFSSNSPFTFSNYIVNHYTFHVEWIQLSTKHFTFCFLIGCNITPLTLHSSSVLFGPVISSVYYVPILIVNMELILLIDPVYLCKAHYKCMFALGFCFDTWWEIDSVFILLGISFSCSLFTCEAHLKDFLYVLYYLPQKYVADSYTDPVNPSVSFQASSFPQSSTSILPVSLFEIII